MTEQFKVSSLGNNISIRTGPGVTAPRDDSLVPYGIMLAHWYAVCNEMVVYTDVNLYDQYSQPGDIWWKVVTIVGDGVAYDLSGSNCWIAEKHNGEALCNAKLIADIPTDPGTPPGEDAEKMLVTAIVKTGLREKATLASPIVTSLFPEENIEVFRWTVIDISEQIKGTRFYKTTDPDRPLFINWLDVVEPPERGVVAIIHLAEDGKYGIDRIA